MKLQPQGLSNRELAVFYKLEASKLLQAGKQLELKANLLELEENLHEFNAKLCNLCPNYILKTFEDQLGGNDQDRKFLAQMRITSSPEKNPL